MVNSVRTACLEFIPLKAGLRTAGTWLCGLIVLASLASAVSVRAEGPDEQYFRIYGAISQADSLSQSGRVDSATAKYREAYTALLDFRKSHPTWNTKVVSFRLNYVTERIADLSQPPAAPAAAVAVATTPEAKARLAPGALPAGTAVKLLEAGAEPRKVLRLHPKAGDKQTLDLTLKMAVDMQIGEAPGQAMKMPAIKMTLDITAMSVSTEGDITYEMVVSDVSVGDEPDALPQVAEAMKASVGGVKGLTSRGTLSNRGLTKGTEVKLPAGADPQMRQAMEQMKETLANLVSPLPEEAAGPGAKWEVRQPLKSQGMTINQTATYELVSLEGDRVSAKNTMVQSAANQKIQNPALPGMDVDVSKMTGQGSGSLTFDLTQLLPSQATGKSHSEVSMGMKVGGQKQAMTVKTDLDIRVESK